MKLDQSRHPQLIAAPNNLLLRLIDEQGHQLELPLKLSRPNNKQSTEQSIPFQYDTIIHKTGNVYLDITFEPAKALSALFTDH